MPNTQVANTQSGYRASQPSDTDEKLFFLALPLETNDVARTTGHFGGLETRTAGIQAKSIVSSAEDNAAMFFVSTCPMQGGGLVPLDPNSLLLHPVGSVKIGPDGAMVLGLTTGVAQSERSVIDSLLLNTVPVANKGGLEVLVPSTSGYGFQQAVNVGRIPEGGRVPYGLVHHPQQGSTVIDGFVKSGAAFGAAVNVVHGKRISKFKGARQRVLARLEKIEAARTREVEREAAVPAVWEEEFDL